MHFPRISKLRQGLLISRTGQLLGLVFVICLCSACESSHQSTEPVTRQVFAMDTYMELTAYGDTAAAALQEEEHMLHQLDKLLDRTDPESVTSCINRSNGLPVPISPMVHDLLEAALSNGNLTQGKFDITIAPLADLWGFTKDAFHVPTASEISEILPFVGLDHVHVFEDQVVLDPGTKIDFGGIAKGLAVEKAQKILAENGVQQGLANLGGDLLVLGNKPNGQPWRVGIQNPFTPDAADQYAGILSVSNVFVLTSGSYERYFEEENTRYHHIIDPFTGSPSTTGLASVTIVADLQPGYGMMSDALSTALFTMTVEEAITFWQTHASLFQMIFITDSGEVWITDGLQDIFQTSDHEAFTYQIIYQ